MPTRSPPLVILGLLLAACSGPEDLGGSIGVRHSLDFDHVRAYWVHHELVICYESEVEPPRGVGGYGSPIPNQVVRLVFDTSRQALAKGKTPLANHDDYPPASISRYVLRPAQGGGLEQEPQFPRLVTGTLDLDKLGTRAGKSLAGRFDAVFEDDHTLWGEFDLELEDP